MFHLSVVSRMKSALLPIALLLLLTGCGGGKPTPTAIAVVAPTASLPKILVKDPTVNPASPVDPGQQVGISVQVDRPTDLKLSYNWTAQAGKILDGQGTSGITYEVPSQPGTYKIGLKITGIGVDIERSTYVTVGEKATRTPPTPVPSLTPIPPTATVIPPTRTPVPDLTPSTTPTKALVSVTITAPKDGIASCPVPSPQLCVFAVKGGSFGVTGDLKIRLFVKPVSPPGDIPGYWYVDGKAYDVNATGDWNADLQIGNLQYPAKPGATLTIVAWVVTSAESAKLDKQIGIAINPTAQASYVAKSSEVNLTVNRSQ
jgi:hypothetical protein